MALLCGRIYDAIKNERYYMVKGLLDLFIVSFGANQVLLRPLNAISH